MMKNIETKKAKQQLGRPPINPDKARSQRIVTFVTKSELLKLKHICEQEHESLSLVVHNIISNTLSSNKV